MSAFEKFLDAAFAEEEDHNDDSDNDHDDDNDDDGLVGGVVDVEPVSIQEIKEEEQQQELLDATPFDVHHHPDDYLINDADEMNDPVHGVNEDAYTANDVNNPYYHSYNTTPVNPLATTTMNRTRNLDSLLSLNHNHMTTSNTTTTTTTLPATKLVEDDTNSVMDRTLKIEDMRKRVEAQLEALTRGNDFQQLRLQVAQLRTGTTNTMITKANIIPTTNTTTTTTTMGIAPPSMLPMTLPTVTTGTRTMENTAWTNSSFSEYDLDFGVEHQLSSPKQHHSRRKSSNRSLPIPDTPIVTTTTGPIAPMMTIHPINDNEDLLQPIPIDLTKTKKEHMTSKASTTKLMATTSGATTTATTATITTTTAQMVGDTVYVQGVDLVDPYGDAGTYTGEVSVVKRKPHGVGEMTYQDGRIYSGGWNQGQWHGKGKDRTDGTHFNFEKSLAPVQMVFCGREF